MDGNNKKKIGHYIVVDLTHLHRSSDLDQILWPQSKTNRSLVIRQHVRVQRGYRKEIKLTEEGPLRTKTKAV